MFSKFRSLIFKIDPETAHNLAIKSLKLNILPNITDQNKGDPIFAVSYTHLTLPTRVSV